MRRRVDQITQLWLDRVACSGHGVCHALDPEHVPLDEWGYPIPSIVETTANTADSLMRLCPAAALRLREGDRGAR